MIASKALRQSPGDCVFIIINRIFLIILAVTTLYPLWYAFMYSISDPLLSDYAGFYLIPKEGIHFDTYLQVIRTNMIKMAYLNTLFVVVVGTCVNMVLTTLTAYALSKRRIGGMTFFTLIIVFTMLFHGGMIPRYLIVRSTGLLNTRWSMIIPNAIIAWNMFILRNFFQNIPDSLEESAMIDGCSVPGILVRIVLPLSVPAIATISLFYAVNHWNDFMQCMLYINDSKKYVLQLILRNLVLQGDDTFMGSQEVLDEGFAVTPESIKMATVMVATIPIMCVYPFIQRFFVKGVMLGSLKG